MTADEPVTNVIASIQQILNAVQLSIAREATALSMGGAATQQLSSLPSDENSLAQVNAPGEVPPLDRTPSYATDEPIFLRESGMPSVDDASSRGFTDSVVSRNPSPAVTQDWPPFNFDVVTTDLFKFFPKDVGGLSEH